jgi:molybdate transport system substrate-binding protein
MANLLKTFKLSAILLLVLTRCALPAEIVVSTAMGIKDFIARASADFGKHRVLINAASSGKLAKQIEAGAPADVFVSASKFWMDYLEKKNLVEEVACLAGTELVLVTYRGSRLKSITSAKKIAVGDKLAPVGMYALEVLRNSGIYRKVKDRLIYAPSVRQIAVWVATGNADAGIIYYSDYIKFKDRLKLLEVFQEKLHTPVRFYIAVVKGSRAKKTALEFLKFILSKPAEEFEKFGFYKVKENGA